MLNELKMIILLIDFINSLKTVDKRANGSLHLLAVCGYFICAHESGIAKTKNKSFDFNHSLQLILANVDGNKVHLIRRWLLKPDN